MPFFELEIPIIQAPMAGGGINTPELVAAVSNNGGLGSFAAAYLSPNAIEQGIRRARELTDRPFAVNLFSPSAELPLSGDVDAQIRFLAPIHERFGIAPPALPTSAGGKFEEEFETILGARPAAVSFTFGTLPVSAMDRLRAAGIFTMGSATTIEEARELEQSGVDAVVAQGLEAGGHRGGVGLIGTMALVPQMVDAVHIPVIAAGGIMDGRGIVAALALGASAVQLGTAFLTSNESGASDTHKLAVLEASEDSTALTRAYSGRWARGIRNSFIETSAQSAEPLPYPWQSALTSAMRSAALKQSDRDVMQMWSGQGTRLSRAVSVAELMDSFRREMRDAIKGGSSLPR